MQLSTGFACHGCLLFILSILTLTLASQLPSEEPFEAKVTERPNTEPPSTMVRRPLPSEMWRLILEKCELTEYFYLLLAYPEMQSLRLTEAVEFDLLEKAFNELGRIDSHTSTKFDYVRYESIVAGIRGFIKLISAQPLGEGEPVSGVDEEVCNPVVRLANKFCENFEHSQLARQILFSVLIEHLHEADIDMETFEEYQDHILYAAALNSNCDQLRALMDQSKVEWNRSVRYLVPAIAQSGSVELYDNVLRGSSLPALIRNLFYTNVIRFNKQELFLEFVLQLKPDIDGTDRTTLQDIFWTCCQHERQELVQVLIKHQLSSLLRIDLTKILDHVIEIGNMGIFTTLLGDSASPGLCKSRPLQVPASASHLCLITCKF